MNEKIKDIKDQAADKIQGIKDGVTATADKIKQMPGDAAAAVSAKARDISNNISTATSEKIHEWVEEFNAAVPAIKALGFSVRNVSLDIGVVPEANVMLVGSVETLNPEKLQEMQSRTTNRAFIFLLNALLTTARFKDQLTAVGIRGIEVNIKLGIPPTITVNMLT